MKKLLFTFALALICDGAQAQTSYDEIFKYLSVGVKQQMEAGLDLTKKGYHWGTIKNTVVTPNFGTVKVMPLYKDGSADIGGHMGTLFIVTPPKQESEYIVLPPQLFLNDGLENDYVDSYYKQINSLSNDYRDAYLSALSWYTAYLFAQSSDLGNTVRN